MLISPFFSFPQRHPSHQQGSEQGSGASLVTALQGPLTLPDLAGGSSQGAQPWAVPTLHLSRFLC